jgi:hypothetical protein
MSKWLIPGLVLIFLLGVVIFTTQYNGPMSGQIIATSGALSVAALGIWLYFKKPQ